MKKLALLFALTVSMFAIGALVPAQAQAGTPIGVAISTYPVNVSVADLGDPVVADGISITSLTLSNSGATAQTVTFYDQGGSTTTVTALFSVVLPAVAGFYRPVGDIDLYSLISVTDLQIRKSATATDVNAYLNYQ